MIDEAPPWTWDSPYWLTAAILTLAVIVIFVLFTVTEANGAPIYVCHDDGKDYVHTGDLTLDAPFVAKHRVEASWVKAPSVRWNQGPIALHGTDVIWIDTKSKEKPAVSIPELIAKLQAKDRGLEVRLEALRHEMITQYFLPVFILAAVCLVWVSRLDKRVTLHPRGGGKSCRPSQVASRRL